MLWVLDNHARKTQLWSLLQGGLGKSSSAIMMGSERAKLELYPEQVSDIQQDFLDDVVISNDTIHIITGTVLVMRVLKLMMVLIIMMVTIMMVV